MEKRHEYLPFGKPDFGAEEIDAVTRVIRSGWVGMGAETIAFESELATAFGVSDVVTVNSCTSALFLSLLAHDVGAGDEVVVPSLTWISTANAARYLGVTPATVRASLTPKTKAVVVVHLGGRAVAVDEIRQAIPAHIAIVEDAAHACGARFADGRPVGGSGNLTCFSFYANKNLSTGEGGAIAVANDGIANRLRSLRQHGLPHDAWKRFIDPRRIELSGIVELGYKMNYTDLQAAIGRVQLRRQAEFWPRRLAIARVYIEALGKLAWPLTLQRGVADPRHARHLFLVQLPVEHIGQSRDDVLLALRERNIGASLHYAPVHAMPLYAKARQGALPVTERLATRIMTLPMSASMSTDDAKEVVAALDDVLRAGQVQRVAVGGRG